MFHEINPIYIKKQEDRPVYRWFQDASNNLDLYVWQDLNGRVNRFQLWNEQVLWEWEEQKGWRFGALDPATGAFRHYQAPVFRYLPLMHHQALQEIFSHMQRQQFQQSNEIMAFIFEKIQALLQTDRKNMQNV